MQERCSKPISSFSAVATFKRSWRSITPLITPGRAIKRSRNSDGNRSWTRCISTSSVPIPSSSGTAPTWGSDVNDGFLLQCVLGCDEQDWDEPEQDRSEQRDLLLQGSQRILGGAEHGERPEDEENRRDVEHHEDQGEHVVLEVELNHGLALRQLPALVGQVLEGRWVCGSEQARREEREEGEHDGHDKKEKDREVGV